MIFAVGRAYSVRVCVHLDVTLLMLRLLGWLVNAVCRC